MRTLVERVGTSNALVVGTFAVTGGAAREARREIGSLRREHPELRLRA